MFNYSKVLIGITALAATILPAVTFSSPAQANSIDGIPDLIIETSGYPAVAVFPKRKESFALGCPAIRNMWIKRGTIRLSPRKYGEIITKNPVVADLRCNGSIKAYNLSDERPPLLLIEHRNGVYHRHYFDGLGFMRALRTGNAIPYDGTSFRSTFPQRGTDIRPYK